MTPGGGPRHSNPLLGITFKIISVAIFVGMSSCIKAAGVLPAGQIAFFRSAFAIVPILVFLAYRKELATAIHTRRPLSHVARAFVGVLAMTASFFALTRLPLPEAITLNYAQPLLVVVFSAIFLGEAVHIFRWSAVIVGFIGVCIVSWPNLTMFETGGAIADGRMLGVIAALSGAGLAAVAMLLVRALVQTEKTATIVLWFSVSASVLSLLTYPFGWDVLTYEQLGFLAGAGLCGGVAQLLMTEGYRHAEASTVAPFEYTSMILGIIIGYLAFGDIPTLYTLVGGVIVIGAGLFIIWREHQLGLKNAAARKLGPVQ